MSKCVFVAQPQILSEPILPSNSSPLGALPARFRRQRVLIIGCGDVGLRTAKVLPAQVNVMALTSSIDRKEALRAQGITPLLGNLDVAGSLRRLSGLAHRVLHLAPPPNDQPSNQSDPRTQALVHALRLRSLPRALVYGSTSGVYGNCNGQWVDETHALAPGTPRAHRRVHAEASVRHLGRSAGVVVHVLRIPGIYAPDRASGTPRDRLLKGLPALVEADDVYTNHIHADDLARACVAALFAGKPQRVTNVSDDTDLKMGDYFDLAADLYGLPRPARVPREQATTELPAMQMSFMNESRRLGNERMKRELRVVLRYSTVHDGLSV